MLERRKFDMGLNELAASHETESDQEFPTALAYFKKGTSNDLYESQGYVWRKRTLRKALENISEDDVERVRASSDEQTLQNIARLASRDFRGLRSYGIEFNGEFIVHDVNGIPCLISAVPVVIDKTPGLEKQATAEDWALFVRAFMQLYTNLLSYFEHAIAHDQPVMTDLGKLEQYVYTDDENTGLGRFTLVDADYRATKDGFLHRFFLREAESAIDAMRTKTQAKHPDLTALCDDLQQLQATYTARIERVPLV